MNILKRTAALFFAVLMTATALCLPSSAAFSGDDRVVVVLDPGHGGKDGGAAGIRNEAYYNLEVALAAKAKLEANGNFIVHMTRSTADKYLTLAQRLVYADSVNADVVISMHFNSSTATGMGGVEVYGSVLDRFYLGTLGQSMSAKVAAAAGIRNRGIFRKYDTAEFYWSEERQWDVKNDSSVGGLSDYYGVLTWGAKFGIPALIIEHAYLSNYSERNLIEDPAVLKAMGEADADALIEYYTNHSHTYGGMTEDYPTRCFAPGKSSERCTTCGHRRNVTTSAADTAAHYWIADGAVTHPTCESDGHGKYVCRYTHNLNDKGCKEFDVHYKDDVTPAFGHDYVITEQREVTHTVDGITTYSCTRCSRSYSETVAAEGHSYALTSHADPTCTKDGSDTYTCSVCSESYDDVIPATGHDFKVTSREDPTCEGEGSEDRVCNTCGYEETVVLDPAGHDMQIYSDVMANCTEEGHRVEKCSVCDKTVETVSPITGHSFMTEAEKPATCEEKGEVRQKCIVCSYEETVITDPSGHDYETTEEVPATCDAAGHRSVVCRVCGKTGTENLPATGHIFGEGKLLKSPGLFADGKEEVVCAVDPTHVQVRSVRDLTVFEYKDENPAGFALLCGGAVAVIAAAVIIAVLILRRRKAPAHAKTNDALEEETVEASGSEESAKSAETAEETVEEPVE